jgi:tRNA pseudouridine38-40 synthase
VKTYKLTIEYDGSKYRGWAEQRNARTVQGELRKALEEFFGGEVDLQGAGRTDAGVHALEQVAHVRAHRARHPDQLWRVLNDKLPAEIAVKRVEEAPAAFHARHDAVSRTYLYQIASRKTAFSKKYVWWVKEPLDAPLMSHATKMLVGRHDFRCFRAEDPTRPSESSIVVVESAELELEPGLIVVRIEASHFLWRMVRRIVGVLVKLGLHEIAIADFERLLSGQGNAKLDVAAWTAPASGLFLERVKY